MELVVVVGVYNKWTHVQLAFQKERPYYLKLFPNTNMRQNKTQSNVERWGTTSAKGGHGG